MNYRKHYDLLIKSRLYRGVVKSELKGYYELHHIVPRCLGGSDDPENLVLLTAREHYIAHLLLAKLNPSSVGLKMAVVMLINNVKHTNKDIRVNSYLYERKRVEAHLASSREGSLSFKDFTGMRFGRLTVVGLAGWRQRERDGCYESRWLCECDCGNYKEAAGKNLQEGSTKSCGCLVKETYPRKGKGITAKGPYKGGSKTWDFTGESRPWHSHHIMKYQHNIDKWLLAGYYYDLWKTYCADSYGSRGHSLYEVYKESHNDSTVARNYFYLMVGMFKDGWIPSEDILWKEFKSAS